MERSSKLRAHAEAIQRMAHTASDPETRGCLLAFAHLWMGAGEQNAKSAEMTNDHREARDTSGDYERSISRPLR